MRVKMVAGVIRWTTPMRDFVSVVKTCRFETIVLAPLLEATGIGVTKGSGSRGRTVLEVRTIRRTRVVKNWRRILKLSMSLTVATIGLGWCSYYQNRRAELVLVFCPCPTVVVHSNGNLLLQCYVVAMECSTACSPTNTSLAANRSNVLPY